MIEEELREQLKKVFATMHGEELYNVWKKIMSARSYWECFKVYRSFNEFADEALKHWNLKDVFSTYDASTNFNVNSLYFSAYHGKFLSTDNLTIDFPPIAENLNEAIDTIIRFKDDFGFARIKEVLDGTADEGTFLTVKQEVLNVLKELDTKDLIKAYNSYSHFSKADDWFFYVPITNECESFTDLTIDDSPIAENIERMVWHAICYDQDYGIQKIRKVLDKHKKYGEIFEPNGYIEY